MENKKNKKTGSLTPEEIEQRDNLNEYIRDEILKYESDKALPKYLWVRINSYRQGKTFAKGSTKDVHMYYSYEDILLTFKFCKYDILKCFNNMVFKDESHKINTMMCIIDRNINTVKDRLKKANEIKEKAEKEIDTKASMGTDIGENYTPKSKKTKDNLEGFW